MRSRFNRDHTTPSEPATMTPPKTPDVKEADVKIFLAKILTGWLAGLPFTNVLLVALLAMFGWMSHYIITVAAPDHFSAMQLGYQTQEISHVAEREASEKRNAMQRESDLMMYDKWIGIMSSRVPRVPPNRSDTAATGQPGSSAN